VSDYCEHGFSEDGAWCFECMRSDLALANGQIDGLRAALATATAERDEGRVLLTVANEDCAANRERADAAEATLATATAREAVYIEALRDVIEWAELTSRSAGYDPNRRRHDCAKARAAIADASPAALALLDVVEAARGARKHYAWEPLDVALARLDAAQGGGR